MTSTVATRVDPMPTASRQRRQHVLLLVAQHSITIALAIAFLVPFVFITLTALMTDRSE